MWKQATRHLTASHKAPDHRPTIDRKSPTLTYRKLQGKNAQIPKRLRGKDAHKYTERIQAERSYIEGYEAKKLLIYQKQLQGEDARIPQQLLGDSLLYNPKNIENTPPKNTKCQICEKSRRKRTASSFKAPKTTHYGDPIS